jgi:hypothetical protein
MIGASIGMLMAPTNLITRTHPVNNPLYELYSQGHSFIQTLLALYELYYLSSR